MNIGVQYPTWVRSSGTITGYQRCQQPLLTVMLCVYVIHIPQKSQGFYKPASNIRPAPTANCPHGQTAPMVGIKPPNQSVANSEQRFQCKEVMGKGYVNDTDGIRHFPVLLIMFDHVLGTKIAINTVRGAVRLGASANRLAATAEQHRANENATAGGIERAIGTLHI
jgi:hypothetical protein